MGQCISKNPTGLTIALSEKDLATANHILTKFTESSEYIALKDEHRNQLCEYFTVNDDDDDDIPNGGDIVVISTSSQTTEQPQKHQQQQQQQQYHEDNNNEDYDIIFNQEDTCLHSLDHWTVAKSAQQQHQQEQQHHKIVNNDDKGNDAVDDEYDDKSTNNSNNNNYHIGNDYEDVFESLLDEDDDDAGDDDRYITIITSSSSACNDNNNNGNTKENIQQTTDTNPANGYNNKNNYAEIPPPYLSKLILFQQYKKQKQKNTPDCKNNSLSDNFHQHPERHNNHHKVKKKTKTSSSYDDDLEKVDLKSETFSKKGQAESKKNSKKHNAGEIQTKGTAMSFGFRKNLNTTPKKLKKLIKGENSKHSKKQDKLNNICNNDNNGGERGEGSGGTNGGDGSFRTDTVIDTNNKTCTDNILVNRDDNGNADLLSNVHFEKMGAAAAATTAIQSNQNAGNGVGNVKLPGAGSRFGFRGVYRPASTDITGRQQRDTHDNIDNNNCNESNTKGVLVSNLKRRSKSAHAGRTPSSSNESDTETGAAPRNTQTKTITFNLKQNSTIEYDRRQFFEQPTVTSTSGNMNAHASNNVITSGLHHTHNNVIVRPTPRVAATSMATAYSKFTLQTVSLPKPEFAVAISINATTPTTPAVSSYVSSPALGGAAMRKRDHSSGRHPLTVAQSSTHVSQRMDAKTAKHMTNSTRRTFSGSREISADSGIASMDMALDSSQSSGASSSKRTDSPKRSRSRPRNLQMVMNGRHRFEVKDLDSSLSSENSSIVEPLALPKLPAENQTVPLPLSGLIRSNTVLSRESYELRISVAKHKENAAGANAKPQTQNIANLITRQGSEEDSESVDEEKLHLDRSATEKGFNERKFKDINTCSSKTSSPGSSVISSWCNAGESLAANDFSNLSLSSSEDSNKQDNKLLENLKDIERKLSFELNDDDLITLNTDVQFSTISSLTEPDALNIQDETDAAAAAKLAQNLAMLEIDVDKLQRPQSICNSFNETKFAEMALEGSTFLLDDETSPTDSLVSSTESEEAACKQKKHKINEELQEKDIDEISPELDVASPLSPGTPTHASHSLSLSDCGNLIDDEIADQPALLFNQESQDGGAESGTSRRDKTDTPTLMESMGSMRASINKSRSALHQAMELSLRTPLSLRKAVMERAESLDTLSPCESICSDDLMMDFDVASSMDSIDRSASIKSRSGSDLNNIDDSELFSEFDRKGSDVMKELNSILRTRSQRSNDKDITAHLPARATRLLNRSRMQQHCTLNNDNDSDSTRSPLSVRRRTNTASSRTSTASSTNKDSTNSSLQRKFQNHHHHHHNYHHHQASSSFHQRDTHSSSDDLMLYDKSFRNAMIQDVLQFKRQLLRLRKILQETETLNPFENDNGQLFTSCGLDSKLLDDIDLASLTSSTTDDPIQELADLRRQVVYLQGQVDDRDRTIRLQKNLIEKLEAEKLKTPHAVNENTTKECVDTATQTERTRPLSIGTEGLSRSKPEFTSYTTYFPAICSDSTTIIQHHQQNPGCLANNQTRRHTIISTTLTNYNQQLSTPRRASIAWEKQTASSYKPVKITLIGDPLKHWQSEGNSLNTNENEFKNTNFIKNSNNKQHSQQPQQANTHNNLILNSKHHHRLQDIMAVNEINNSHKSHQQHHQHHQQQLQHQQQQQFYKTSATSSHQHNNLKPTVTIV